MDTYNNGNIVTVTTKRKLSYKWTPLRIIALVVLVIAIITAIVGLYFYSQAGKSSDIYGAAWVWTLIVLAIYLLFLSGFLLAFA